MGEDRMPKITYYKHTEKRVKLIGINCLERTEVKNV
jgi:hypothetical protein